MKKEKIVYFKIPDEGYMIGKCDKCGRTIFHFNKKFGMEYFKKSFQEKQTITQKERKIQAHIKEIYFSFKCKCGNKIVHRKHIAVTDIVGMPYATELGVIWEGIKISYSKKAKLINGGKI